MMLLALALGAGVAATPAMADPAKPAKPAKSHHPHWTTPPGYDPPERRAVNPEFFTYPWYGPPRFYSGRWNGGGFGPCWTKTPIGPIWNCGR